MEMNPGSILWNPNYKPVQLCELALHSLLSPPTLSPTISHTFYNMLPHRTSLRQFFLEIWTPRVSQSISAPKTRGGFLDLLFLLIFFYFPSLPRVSQSFFASKTHGGFLNQLFLLIFSIFLRSLGSLRAFLLLRPTTASWACFFFLFFLFFFILSDLTEHFCS